MPDSEHFLVWEVSERKMRRLLVEAHEGEDPDLIMLREFANAKHAWSDERGDR